MAFKQKCSTLGIMLERNEIKITIEKEHFVKLRYLIKNSGQEQQNIAKGKILRIDREIIIQFRDKCFSLANSAGQIQLSYEDDLKNMCQEIRDSGIDCMTFNNKPLDDHEKILLLNFTRLLFCCENKEINEILNGINEANEKMISDLAAIVIKSSGIPRKNPYMLQAIQAIITRNYDVLKLMNSCHTFLNK